MTEDKTFERVDFTITNLAKDDYENCNFINCNFHNTSLMNVVFRECNFEGCDLSLTNLTNSTINEVSFIDCKMIGIQFEQCNPFLFSVNFNNCNLKLSVFFKIKLKKTLFKNCNLQETDFTEADMTAAMIDNCDLQGAIFYRTNLEKANFSTSYNYSMNPEENRLKKARFSRMGLAGLLNKYGIEID